MPEIVKFRQIDDVQISVKVTKIGLVAVIKFETPAAPGELALLMGRQSEPMECHFETQQGLLFDAIKADREAGGV